MPLNLILFYSTVCHVFASILPICIIWYSPMRTLKFVKHLRLYQIKTFSLADSELCKIEKRKQKREILWIKRLWPFWSNVPVLNSCSIHVDRYKFLERGLVLSEDCINTSVKWLRLTHATHCLNISPFINFPQTRLRLEPPSQIYLPRTMCCV